MEKKQFDETIKHIEDRLWASSVLKNRKKLFMNLRQASFIFMALTSWNLKRVITISKILKTKIFKNKKKSIICITLNKPIKINGKYLVEKTINDLKKFKEIDKIFISTTDKIKQKKR